MPFQFLISPCGCATVLKVFTTVLQIIDSEKLRGIYVPVVRLIVEDKNGDIVKYEINTTFEDKQDFFNYLNDTFRIINNFSGLFVLDGNFIDYQNVEEHISIEVVAIINWTPVTVVMTEEGTTFQADYLIGANLDPLVAVDNQLQQQTYQSDFDPITGTIFNIQYYEDSILSFRYLEPIPS